ncbi:stalk domain-containing protein [Paenibacillus fonticola]|uniref:stalk domain-containing protein n=1 Tax=Paenibacillus fonticola TaxID=379896 RepID=UPI00036F9A84|nr:stalk domain-containing protein [Paenibacillus fonticola]
MRNMYSRLLIAVMIMTLIGGTVAGAAGVQSEPSQGDSHEALSRISSFAGSGHFDDWDGGASEASFRMPQGIAVLKDGSLLVADTQNHLIRQVKHGEVSTYAGLVLEEDNVTPEGAWQDGAKDDAVFNGPSGIDIDKNGNLYIADTDNHRVRKISKDGTVTTIAGDGIIGDEDSTGTRARFYHPQDVAVASDGTLYVADTLNHLIRQITPDGQVTTLNAPSDRVVEVEAGYVVPAGDYADGALSASKFNEPASIAIDHKGNLYVSDTGNHVIRYIDLAKGTVATAAGLSPGEKPVYAAGSLYAEGGYADGASSEARFLFPKGIAVTEENGLMIADSLNHTIRYFSDGLVSTIAGVPAQFGQVDGINGQNLLHYPTDVAVLPSGGLLIADSYNNKIRELEYYRLPSNLPRNEQVKVVLDDSVISFATQPEVEKGYTMVPVRALSEMMGYKVGLLDNQRTIELAKGEVSIKLQLGSEVISVQNAASEAEEQRVIEAAPYTKDGRIYVPIRFFSEAFGADVQWDPYTRTVVLREITEAVDKLPVVDRKSRTAVIEQIRGKVWINQAGGSLTYQAYNGMKLHQGDHIVTENDTSAIIKTADREDEITISENSKLYISNLSVSDTSHTKHTSFMLWSGLASANVSSLANAKDTFNILTPTAVNNVRGTNFMVSIDPVTGLPKLFVSSGLVQASGKGTSQDPAFVYPAQQLTLFPNSQAPNEPYIVDPSDLVNQASPAVIEALLRAKQKIDRENEELLERMRNGASGSNPGDLPQGDLDQYQQNLNQLLGNIVKQTLVQKKMDPIDLQTLIDQVNKQSDAKIDLNHVPPLQLSEKEKQQQERQKQLEEEQKKRLEQQNKERQLAEQRQSLIAKVEAERERIEQENKKKQEEAAKRAEALYKQSLSDAEKQKFEQRQKDLEQRKQQQEQVRKSEAPTPTPTSTSTSTSTSWPTPTPTPTPANTAPVVVELLSDIMVNEDLPFEFNLSEVFHDADGDELTFAARSSDLAVAEAAVDGPLLHITPTGNGSSEIHITADDGRGGLTETSFRVAYYRELQDLRAEVSSDFIGLYWDEYEEEEVSYQVYMNGELIDSVDTNHILLTDLEPDTVYDLRVFAVNGDEEIKAFGDYSVTTQPMYEPME